MNPDNNTGITDDIKKQRRFGFFVDGMGYSLRLFRLAHERLLTTLAGLETNELDEEAHNHAVFSAVLDAWSMIDCAYNCWDLCDQFPKLPKNELFVQVFQRKASYIKDLRNYRQHLRGAPDRLNEDLSYPLWGALSWASRVQPNQCHTIFSGNMMPNVNVNSLIYNRATQQFTSRLVMDVDGKRIDLEALTSSVLEFRTGFLDWMTTSGLAVKSTGKVPVIRMEVIPDEE